MEGHDHLSLEDQELWMQAEIPQQPAADSLPLASNQEYFRQTYFLPNLRDVMKKVTDNQMKNRARAARHGRSAIGNPPSREP